MMGLPGGRQPDAKLAETIAKLHHAQLNHKKTKRLSGARRLALPGEQPMSPESRGGLSESREELLFHHDDSENQVDSWQKLSQHDKFNEINEGFENEFDSPFRKYSPYHQRSPLQDSPIWDKNQNNINWGNNNSLSHNNKENYEKRKSFNGSENIELPGENPNIERLIASLSRLSAGNDVAEIEVVSNSRTVSSMDYETENFHFRNGFSDMSQNMSDNRRVPFDETHKRTDRKPQEQDSVASFPFLGDEANGWKKNEESKTISVDEVSSLVDDRSTSISLIAVAQQSKSEKRGDLTINNIDLSPRNEQRFASPNAYNQKRSGILGISQRIDVFDPQMQTFADNDAESIVPRRIFRDSLSSSGDDNSERNLGKKLLSPVRGHVARFMATVRGKSKEKKPVTSPTDINISDEKQIISRSKKSKMSSKISNGKDIDSETRSTQKTTGEIWNPFGTLKRKDSSAKKESVTERYLGALNPIEPDKFFQSDVNVRKDNEDNAQGLKMQQHPRGIKMVHKMPIHPNGRSENHSFDFERNPPLRGKGHSRSLQKIFLSVPSPMNNDFQLDEGSPMSKSMAYTVESRSVISSKGFDKRNDSFKSGDSHFEKNSVVQSSMAQERIDVSSQKPAKATDSSNIIQKLSPQETTHREVQETNVNQETSQSENATSTGHEFSFKNMRAQKEDCSTDNISLVKSGENTDELDLCMEASPVRKRGISHSMKKLATSFLKEPDNLQLDFGSPMSKSVDVRERTFQKRVNFESKKDTTNKDTMHNMPQEQRSYGTQTNTDSCGNDASPVKVHRMSHSMQKLATSFLSEPDNLQFDFGSPMSKSVDVRDRTFHKKVKFKTQKDTTNKESIHSMHQEQLFMDSYGTLKTTDSCDNDETSPVKVQGMSHSMQKLATSFLSESDNLPLDFGSPSVDVRERTFHKRVKFASPKEATNKESMHTLHQEQLFIGIDSTPMRTDSRDDDASPPVKAKGMSRSMQKLATSFISESDNLQLDFGSPMSKSVDVRERTFHKRSKFDSNALFDANNQILHERNLKSSDDLSPIRSNGMSYSMKKLATSFINEPENLEMDFGSPMSKSVDVRQRPFQRKSKDSVDFNNTVHHDQDFITSNSAAKIDDSCGNELSPVKGQETSRSMQTLPTSFLGQTDNLELVFQSRMSKSVDVNEQIFHEQVTFESQHSFDSVNNESKQNVHQGKHFIARDGTSNTPDSCGDEASPVTLQGMSHSMQKSASRFINEADKLQRDNGSPISKRVDVRERTLRNRVRFELRDPFNSTQAETVTQAKQESLFTTRDGTSIRNDFNDDDQDQLAKISSSTPLPRNWETVEETQSSAATSPRANEPENQQGQLLYTSTSREETVRQNRQQKHAPATEMSAMQRHPSTTFAGDSESMVWFKASFPDDVTGDFFSETKPISGDFDENNNSTDLHTKKIEQKVNPGSIQSRLQLLKQQRIESIARNAQRKKPYNIHNQHAKFEILDSDRQSTGVELNSTNMRTSHDDDRIVSSSNYSSTDRDMERAIKIDREPETIYKGEAQQTSKPLSTKMANVATQDCKERIDNSNSFFHLNTTGKPFKSPSTYPIEDKYDEFMSYLGFTTDSVPQKTIGTDATDFMQKPQYLPETTTVEENDFSSYNGREYNMTYIDSTSQPYNENMVEEMMSKHTQQLSKDLHENTDTIKSMNRFRPFNDFPVVAPDFPLEKPRCSPRPDYSWPKGQWNEINNSCTRSNTSDRRQVEPELGLSGSGIPTFWQDLAFEDFNEESHKDSLEVFKPSQNLSSSPIVAEKPASTDNNAKNQNHILALSKTENIQEATLSAGQQLGPQDPHAMTTSRIYEPTSLIQNLDTSYEPSGTTQHDDSNSRYKHKISLSAKVEQPEKFNNGGEMEKRCRIDPPATQSNEALATPVGFQGHYMEAEDFNSEPHNQVKPYNFDGTLNASMINRLTGRDDYIDARPASEEPSNCDTHVEGNNVHLESIHSHQPAERATKTNRKFPCKSEPTLAATEKFHDQEINMSQQIGEIRDISENSRNLNPKNCKLVDLSKQSVGNAQNEINESAFSNNTKNGIHQVNPCYHDLVSPSNHTIHKRSNHSRIRNQNAMNISDRQANVTSTKSSNANFTVKEIGRYEETPSDAEHHRLYTGAFPIRQGATNNQDQRVSRQAQASNAIEVTNSKPKHSASDTAFKESRQTHFDYDQHQQQPAEPEIRAKTSIKLKSSMIVTSKPDPPPYHGISVDGQTSFHTDGKRISPYAPSSQCCGNDDLETNNCLKVNRTSSIHFSVPQEGPVREGSPLDSERSFSYNDFHGISDKSQGGRSEQESFLTASRNICGKTSEIAPRTHVQYVSMETNPNRTQIVEQKSQCTDGSIHDVNYAIDRESHTNSLPDQKIMENVMRHQEPIRGDHLNLLNEYEFGPDGYLGRSYNQVSHERYDSSNNLPKLLLGSSYRDSLSHTDDQSSKSKVSQHGFKEIQRYWQDLTSIQGDESFRSSSYNRPKSILDDYDSTESTAESEPRNSQHNSNELHSIESTGPDQPESCASAKSVDILDREQKRFNKLSNDLSRANQIFRIRHAEHDGDTEAQSFPSNAHGVHNSQLVSQHNHRRDGGIRSLYEKLIVTDEILQNKEDKSLQILQNKEDSSKCKQKFMPDGLFRKPNKTESNYVSWPQVTAEMNAYSNREIRADSFDSSSAINDSEGVISTPLSRTVMASLRNSRDNRSDTKQSKMYKARYETSECIDENIEVTVSKSFGGETEMNPESNKQTVSTTNSFDTISTVKSCDVDENLSNHIELSVGKEKTSVKSRKGPPYIPMRMNPDDYETPFRYSRSIDPSLYTMKTLLSDDTPEQDEGDNKTVLSVEEEQTNPRSFLCCSFTLADALDFSIRACPGRESATNN